MTTIEILDEAYQRLHETGPEFGGWLSNHGPMAVEAMARRGHADGVDGWLESYLPRLEDFPRGSGPIGADWREALGDPKRIADWTVYFRQETGERPWREVLGTWWPRLLPAAIASATHGIIRVGHAVRALTADGDDPVHVVELAHGLAYWAARWQPIPGAGPLAPSAGGNRPPGPPRSTAPALAPGAALAAVPRIADQSGGFRTRLPRLADLAGWPAALAAPIPGESPADIQAWVADLADAAVFGYLEYGHGSPVMLVHAATAPTAVLRTLPALDQELWAPSAAAAWEAAAVITSVYAPSAPARPDKLPAAPDPETAFARAVDHGDEHVIKFADTALDTYQRTGNPSALTAASYAAEIIPREP
jgi:hypothetical protein